MKSFIFQLNSSQQLNEGKQGPYLLVCLLLHPTIPQEQDTQITELLHLRSSVMCKENHYLFVFANKLNWSLIISMSLFTVCNMSTPRLDVIHVPTSEIN